MDTALSLLIGLLVGLIAIALAIFFGLREFRRSLADRLSSIEVSINNISNSIQEIGRVIVERLPTMEWYLKEIDEKLSRRLSASSDFGTVERTLKNLGKVRITVEPSGHETVYIIEGEKELKGGWIERLSKETELASKERELFGKEPTIRSSFPNRLALHLPSTDPKACTEYLTFFLNWLDSTYFESLERIKEFEEPILKE